jgi:signal transduction histidine kinase
MIDAGKFKSVPVEQLKLMLEISDAQVSRLARLIEQLLDVSRIDEGRLILQYESFDLSEMVQAAINQCRHQIEAAQCSLTLALEPGIEGRWDRLRLEQVFLNLLMNSTKYAAGGRIEVRTFRRAGKAVLVVADDGMGIAPEDQARIFDRFERAVPLKNFGGLGLGLYVSREIVRLHRGGISVQSELGRGATFEVELPFSPEALALN